MTDHVLLKNMSFKVGQTMTIKGVATSEASNFAVNIGHSEQDIALHLNPRFDAHGDEKVVVCNSYTEGSWCEEQRGDTFPFSEGKEFKISITFTKEDFLVTLTDGSEIRFPNRQGDEKYRHVFFQGDARIQMIEIV